MDAACSQDLPARRVAPEFRRATVATRRRRGSVAAARSTISAGSRCTLSAAFGAWRTRGSPATSHDAPWLQLCAGRHPLPCGHRCERKRSAGASASGPMRVSTCSPRPAGGPRRTRPGSRNRKDRPRVRHLCHPNQPETTRTTARSTATSARSLQAGSNAAAGTRTTRKGVMKASWRMREGRATTVLLQGGLQSGDPVDVLPSIVREARRRHRDHAATSLGARDQQMAQVSGSRIPGRVLGSAVRSPARRTPPRRWGRCDR